MAYTIPQVPSLNLIDSTPDSQLCFFATFDSAIDELSTLQNLAGVFTPGAKLLDIRTGDSFVNSGTTDDPIFVPGASEDGVVLLGFLRSANFNITPVEKFKYSAFTGYPFQVGDVITGATSTETADVDANNELTDVLDVSTVSGPFDLGETIDGTIGHLTTENEAGGPFTVGETITGGTSGATAVVLTVGTNELTYDTLAVSTFQAGEEITGGTSSATADVLVPLAPGSATLDSFSPAADQAIVLQGGEKLIVTDIVIDSPTGNGFNNVDDIEFNTGTIRSGVQIATVGNGPLLATLIDSNSYINSQGTNKITLPIANKTVGLNGTTLYMSVGTAEGAPLTANVLVYGYIIH